MCRKSQTNVFISLPFFVKCFKYSKVIIKVPVQKLHFLGISTNEGPAFTESKSINLSLSCLGQSINHCCQGPKRFPVRTETKNLGIKNKLCTLQQCIFASFLKKISIKAHRLFLYKLKFMFKKLRFQQVIKKIFTAAFVHFSRFYFQGRF